MATEKRLIDANAFIFEYCMNCGGGCDVNEECCATVFDLRNAPTVDAVEVVHGRWEHAEYHGFLRCSECKDVYIDDTWIADGKWNYCPNCGAKMDGDGNV